MTNELCTIQDEQMSKRIEVTTNFYPIEIKNQVTVYRYDVSIVTSKLLWKRIKDIDILKRNRNDHAVVMRRRVAMHIIEHIFSRYGVLSRAGVYSYDMSAILFTNEPVPQKYQQVTLEKNQLSQDLQNMFEDERVTVFIDPCKDSAHTFNITDFGHSSPTYVGTSENTLPIRQFFEILLNQKALRSGNHFAYGRGSSFLTNGEAYGLPKEQLRGERSVFHGSKRSVRFIETSDSSVIPALVIDAKKAVFFNSVPLMKMIESKLGQSPLSRIDHVSFKKFHSIVEGIIRSIRLQHSSGTTFVAGGLSSKPVKYLKFNHRLGGHNRKQNHTRSDSDRNWERSYSQSISFCDYYRSLGIRIRDDLPSVYIAGKVIAYFPIEVLHILPWQRVAKSQRSPDEIEALSKICDLLPDERFRAISKHFEALDLHDSGGRYSFMGAFGASIDDSPIKLEASVRIPPSLIYGKSNVGSTVVNIDSVHANWKSRGTEYLVKASIKVWQILYDESNDYRRIENFADGIVEECFCRGISVNKPVVKNVRFEDLEAYMNHLRVDHVEQHVFIIYVDARNNSHGSLKLFERLFQIITQHICTSTLKNATRQSIVLENIVNKLNCKNFGQCYGVLPERNVAAKWITNEKTLIFGYDVCHPDKETRCKLFKSRSSPPQPSVVGMSFNGAACCETFIGDYAFQDGFKERVNEVILEDRMYWVLKMFQSNRRRVPDTIIILRDGVSEGQFEMVKLEEVAAMKRGIENFAGAYNLADFAPKILCIVTCKRHHKRFVVEKGREFINCPPLTVVDGSVTRLDITEFFMQAHKVVKGTGKMPAYSVLINEANFSVDEVQSMMMALCYTHQIVCQAISIPEPIFQADEWAKRGRNNFLAMFNRVCNREQIPLIGDREVDWNKVTKRLCYMSSGGLESTRTNA